MGYRITYIKGQYLSLYNIIFIEEVNEKIDKSGKKTRYARLKCSCGKIFEARISSAISGSIRSCGCRKREHLISMNFKHGLVGHPLYTVWINIKKRIFDDNNPAYKDYGGRGIIMFPPWIHDFQLFYDYVSALPNFNKKGYSLDRIDNDGNYEPGNLRWVTWSIQMINKRKNSKNTSGYTGIYKMRNSWQAKIGNKGICIGTFKTKEEAVTARNNYIIQNNLSEYKIQEVH